MQAIDTRPSFSSHAAWIQGCPCPVYIKDNSCWWFVQLSSYILVTQVRFNSVHLPFSFICFTTCCVLAGKIKTMCKLTAFQQRPLNWYSSSLSILRLNKNYSSMWRTLLYTDSLVVDINSSHLILVVLRLTHKVTLLDSQHHSGLKNALVLHSFSMIVRLMC